MFPFDRNVAASLAAARTDELVVFFASVTNLGEVWFCIFAASLICLFLYASRQQRFVPELFVISLGSALTVWALKIFFALPRPVDPVSLVTVDSFSFPSGHAAAAATLYGFLMWMMLGTGKTDRVRTLLAGIFLFTIVLVGFSRIYLGVHYVSDVIAGYFIGFLWVMIGVRLARNRRFTRLFAR